MKARVFIGSSSEGLPIANAIQENLQRDAYCDVWTQGIFGLGQTTMDALLQAVTDHDFGVFVLSPDDIQVIRNNAYSAARDNVLLESALFMGRYAKDRAYLVKPMGVRDFHIPTDLLGVTLAEYDQGHLVTNPVAALGPASNQIRAAIGTNKSYNRTLTIGVTSTREPAKTYPLKLQLDIRNQADVDCVIRAHHFLCNGALRAASNAKGNPSSKEYELTFPDRDGKFTLFEYLLVRGDRVRTWFPIDPAHSEEDVKNALANGLAGELHCTCFWLGTPAVARRYVYRV